MIALRVPPPLRRLTSPRNGRKRSSREQDLRHVYHAAWKAGRRPRGETRPATTCPVREETPGIRDLRFYPQLKFAKIVATAPILRRFSDGAGVGASDRRARHDKSYHEG